MVHHNVFRGGNYQCFVFLGKRTIKEGECMAIWLLDGRQKIVVGPMRKRLWCSNIRFLDRHQVDQHQYIIIYHRNGRREHIRGPYAIFENPVHHQKIKIKDVVSVDGFESLVVYKESAKAAETDGQVERRIVRGPCQFVPDADEWVHKFNWTAIEDDNKGGESDRRDKKGKKKAGDGNVEKGVHYFTKLKTIPTQMPISAQVRTSNDVVLSVSVMVVFECIDIERMLDSTRDPIGDFQNSISADLLSFAAKVSYEKFLEMSAEMLSNLSTFPLLLQRADNVGFKIHKVVYRGYKASQEIQAMREARVKIESDLKLEDAKFERKAANIKQELELEELVHSKKLQQKEAEYKVEEDAKERTNAQQIAFLTQLSHLKVDVTKYLVSMNDNPDKIIRVEQSSGDKKAPILVNTN